MPEGRLEIKACAEIYHDDGKCKMSIEVAFAECPFDLNDISHDIQVALQVVIDNHLAGDNIKGVSELKGLATQNVKGN